MGRGAHRRRAPSQARSDGLTDIATCRVVHWNGTTHPTAGWTIQQFRNGLPLDAAYRFLVHDRDSIFAPAVDEALHSMSLQVLRTPVRAPQANAPLNTSITLAVTSDCTQSPARVSRP
jgi:hypothetical protein